MSDLHSTRVRLLAVRREVDEMIADVDRRLVVSQPLRGHSGSRDEQQQRLRVASRDQRDE